MFFSQVYQKEKLIFVLFNVVLFQRVTSLIPTKSDGAIYSFKESSSCSKSEQCDGLRTCVKNRCTGTSRPPKSEFYLHGQWPSCPQSSTDLNWNIKNYYCDGLRTCVNGSCQGVARLKSATYLYKEVSGVNCSSFDAKIKDYNCDGLRTCSSSGTCQGTARWPKNDTYFYTETSDNRCPIASEPNFAIKDYFCDGRRTCLTTGDNLGHCTGRARLAKNAAYILDESPSNNRCPPNSSLQNQTVRNYFCDGLRTCSADGICTGTARPPKDIFYLYSQKPQGNCMPQFSYDNIAADYLCDGKRTCGNDGYCTGRARWPKHPAYSYDESKTGIRCPQNSTDPNYAIRDYFCDGSKTCSQWGWCQGTARPNKDGTYIYDEKNAPIQCKDVLTSPQFNMQRTYLCDGQRQCAPWGQCSTYSARPVKNAVYLYDEQKTSIRCPISTDLNYVVRDYFCDGFRTCSQWGWCQGEARMPQPKTAIYYIPEENARCPYIITSPPQQLKIKNYYCDGFRYCSDSGYCSGQNRMQKDQVYYYAYNETKTNSKCPISTDYNYPIRDFYCSGNRVCSSTGQCQGKAFG